MGALDGNRLADTEARSAQEGVEYVVIAFAFGRSRPEASGSVVFLEPRIAAVGRTVGRADKDGPAGRQQPVEQGGGRLGRHPMQGPAYGDDIESPDVQGKRFGSALDQREILPNAGGRFPCGSEHSRLRIDSDDTADVRREAQRQQPRTCPKVDQAMLLAKFQSPGNRTEEFGRIGRPELLVKRNRGCETSHEMRPRAADQAGILNPASDSRVLSAAKRGRGRDPLRSNGEVRWCFVQRRRADCEATAHLTLPALTRGSPPSPPAARAERASEGRRRDFARSHSSTMARQIIVRDCGDSDAAPWRGCRSFAWSTSAACRRGCRRGTASRIPGWRSAGRDRGAGRPKGRPPPVSCPAPRRRTGGARSRAARSPARTHAGPAA